MNSKLLGKCQFALKLIQFSTIPMTNCTKMTKNVVNFVYYGKERQYSPNINEPLRHYSHKANGKAKIFFNV